MGGYVESPNGNVRCISVHYIHDMQSHTIRVPSSQKCYKVAIRRPHGMIGIIMRISGYNQPSVCAIDLNCFNLLFILPKFIMRVSALC